MIKGLGTDIIEIARIAKVFTHHPQRFFDRLFTPSEQAYFMRYADPITHLAGRFCAKEAIAKALGVGITSILSWKDMSIVNDKTGKPVVIFSEKIRQHFNGLPVVLVSISHCNSYATAVAIWTTTES